MKKYVKPQMRVHAIASRLILAGSDQVQMRVRPDEEGDGSVL